MADPDHMRVATMLELTLDVARLDALAQALERVRLRFDIRQAANAPRFNLGNDLRDVSSLSLRLRRSLGDREITSRLAAHLPLNAPDLDEVRQLLEILAGAAEKEAESLDQTSPINWRRSRAGLWSDLARLVAPIADIDPSYFPKATTGERENSPFGNLVRAVHTAWELDLDGVTDPAIYQAFRRAKVTLGSKKQRRVP